MRISFNPILLSDTINTTAMILIIVGCALLFASAIVSSIVVVKKKKKNQTFDGSVWLTALGEKENVKEVSAVGSRLNINLVDKEKIDREKLKELGVSSVLVMSNKVTLVIEGKAEAIAESIKKNL